MSSASIHLQESKNLVKKIVKIQCVFFQDELRRNADKKQEVVLVKDDNKPVSHSGPQAGETPEERMRLHQFKT